MGSLLGELARREAVVRQRIKETHEQIAAPASQLEDEQDRLSRLTITRETVEEIWAKQPGRSMSPKDRPASPGRVKRRFGRRCWVR
ncbi:hypothetical protein EDD27_2381 [Nonomuraea polychroma]|uniref:Uncharacterized protein n=2 Tax=Nonomuraea polychroma TaxID=46176 RepID=A0A438M2H9_9ACTN|nr:hypothetical protein EDD27_2381 [Nonomuraea polychroma]